MGNLEDFLDLMKSQHPPPLPPTRKIELIRTEINISGPCCSCRRSAGKLTCGRCKAIKYCGTKCQKDGWKEHKDICNKIKKHTEETKAAIVELSERFGGTDVLLQSPLVKEGRFKYMDITAELMGEPPLKARNLQEKYILSRMRLIEAYVTCGEEALSCIAFRLAQENMLDLLCLSYSEPDGEHVRWTYCGWMVAAGMDQQALNYLCYFRYRLMSPHSLPYLDLSKNEDIEGESYLKLIKEKKNSLDWAADMWFHDFMLIALIKYKRLQSLIVQTNKNMGSWKMFMKGTHQRAGQTSKILKIRGNTRIIERLKQYVVEGTIILRIKQLDSQIKRILSAVNESNPLIIPGLIDRSSIPEKPSLKDKGEDKVLSDDEDDDYGGYIHDACWAFGNYGYAWNMSTAYTGVLEFFLRTGNVMPVMPSFNKKLGCFPIEGLLQAAFDVDPTRFYGRGDDLGIEGLVPYWAFMESVEENVGKAKEKGNGNSTPAIGQVHKEEVKNLKKIYSTVCWYCSKEDVKLFKCVGCRKARYCKEECQEDDWEVHGNYCLKQQEQRKNMTKEVEGMHEN